MTKEKIKPVLCMTCPKAMLLLIFERRKKKQRKKNKEKKNLHTGMGSNILKGKLPK